MAVVRERAVPATYDAIRDRVRIKVGDSARTRFSTTLLDDAIRDSMFDLYNELGRDSSTILVSADLTYTGSAQQVALADSYAAAPVVKVQDITTAAKPIDLIRVDDKEIDRFVDPNSPELGGVLRVRRYAIRGENIAVRAVPNDDLSLRIWYLGNPFTVPVTTGGGSGGAPGAADQHPLPVAHEEVLVLGAALRLYENDGAGPPEMIARFGQKMQDFRNFAQRDRGMHRVARVRRN